MALQTSLITFTGKLGNVIGYRSNDKYLLRSAPQAVRQTTATRHAAQRFGMASKKGALIRNAFYNRLDVRCDGSHVNRLNQAIILAGRNNTAAITGFRFNKHTGIDKFFALAPQLSTDNVLHIPAQSLPRLKGITALEIKVIATRINFSAHRVINTEAATLTLDLQEAFAGAAISVDVPGQGTLMVALQVIGMQYQEAACNVKYLAADIVAVSAQQTPQLVYKPSYRQQTVRQQRQKILLNTASTHPAHLIAQRE
jgi:hypothetical protein